MIRTVLVVAALAAGITAATAMSRAGTAVTAEARGYAAAGEAAAARYYTAGWLSRRVVTR